MSFIRSVADNLTHPFGIQIDRYPRPESTGDRTVSEALIAQLEGCYREHLFSEIPKLESRLPLLGRLLGTTVSEAMYILRALHRSLSLPGDICEMGIAQGATSTLMANEIRGTDKKLWLFDSFKGLPKPTEKDVLIDDIFNLGSMDAYTGTMAYDVTSVKGRLEEIQFPLSRIEIVPGFIEETVKSTKLPKQVCFAYIDFDFYEPILVGLRFLDPVLAVGGFVVVDDYGWFSTGAKTAVDEYVAAENGRYELTLPNPSAGHFAVLQKKA